MECEGRFTWGPKSQVPLMLAKSQHGGKAPTFEPQETIKMWFILIEVGRILIILCKHIHGAC